KRAGVMKALVIGGGGREHALAWKLAQSERVQAVFVAPGNAGTALEPHLMNVAITDLAELAQFALDEKIDLTVVGPEAALLGGAAPAGSRVVVEEFLDGEEASFIVVCDGRTVLSLATSQDHKRLGNDDAGPNTGGMGAYSPAPVVTPNVHARVMHEIVLPTLAGMAAEGRPFTGFLYAGLMIDSRGTPRTVEFNCRLGDPEAQPILMRLK